ncbi:hypothetical protein, partial [Mesorhizobium sp.]|uniref:hypothetical protein n=1 Tax=Mesorhizobium sp. TaxID=1871066 RepID=UPI0025EF6194
AAGPFVADGVTSVIVLSSMPALRALVSVGKRMSFPLILAARLAKSRLAKSLPNQAAWFASGNRTGQSRAVYLSLAATAGEAQ